MLLLLAMILSTKTYLSNNYAETPETDEYYAQTYLNDNIINETIRINSMIPKWDEITTFTNILTSDEIGIKLKIDIPSAIDPSKTYCVFTTNDWPNTHNDLQCTNSDYIHHITLVNDNGIIVNSYFSENEDPGYGCIRVYEINKENPETDYVYVKFQSDHDLDISIWSDNIHNIEFTIPQNSWRKITYGLHNYFGITVKATEYDTIHYYTATIDYNDPTPSPSPSPSASASPSAEPSSSSASLIKLSTTLLLLYLFW